MARSYNLEYANRDSKEYITETFVLVVAVVYHLKVNVS